MTLRAVGDDLRQGGLAGAGRPPQQNGREEFVGFDGAAQQLALAHDVFLADELLQRARAHARRQRRFGLHTLLHGVVEKVGHEGDYTVSTAITIAGNGLFKKGKIKGFFSLIFSLYL